MFYEYSSCHNKTCFLRNLQIGPSRVVLNYTRLERLAKNKHSNIYDLFVSYEENEVLWIKPHIVHFLSLTIAQIRQCYITLS